MRYLRTLTIHFFISRSLRRLNKQKEISVNSTDIRLMFFLKVKGPLRPSGFDKLNHSKKIHTGILPKLLKLAFIEKKDGRYQICFEGDQYLRKYADMLATARMDRITGTLPKKRRRKKFL